MNTIQRTLALTLLAAGLGATTASADDFGVWTELGAEKKINKQLSVEGSFDYRADRQLKQTGRWGVAVGLNYKPVKFLKIAGGYAFIRDHYPTTGEPHYNKREVINGYNVDHNFWRSKHRFYFDVTGKKGVGRFTFSLRERYQYTHFMGADYRREKLRTPLAEGQSAAEGVTVYNYAGRQFVDSETEMRRKHNKNTHYLRSRLEVDYNIRHCPLTPFVGYEVSNNLSDAMRLDKSRLSIGTDWKINKHHSLSLAYVYQNGHDDDSDDDIHVISIGYGFKF